MIAVSSHISHLSLQAGGLGDYRLMKFGVRGHERSKVRSYAAEMVGAVDKISGLIHSPGFEWPVETLMDVQ